MRAQRIITVLLVLSLALWVLLDSWGAAQSAPPVDAFGRGEWFFMKSEHESAVYAYRTALKEGLEEPRAKEALFKIARSLHEGGRYVEAIDAYQKFIRKYPQTDEANRAQGFMEWIQQNQDIDPEKPV